MCVILLFSSYVGGLFGWQRLAGTDTLQDTHSLTLYSLEVYVDGTENEVIVTIPRPFKLMNKE